MIPRRHRFGPAIDACRANGNRLLLDAEFLAYGDPPTTATALAIIAQEELAKAFLLHLVDRGVVPWSSEVRRAARDHKCKQLLAIVMDFLSPDTDEFLKRADNSIRGCPRPFPSEVADAINIFCHEKVRRWESSRWVWAEEPSYDRRAQRVADGSVERLKQDTLYVRIGRTGQVVAPADTLSQVDLSKELERGRRFQRLIEDVIQGGLGTLDYAEVTSSFAAVFGLA